MGLRGDVRSRSGGSRKKEVGHRSRSERNPLQTDAVRCILLACRDAKKGKSWLPQNLGIAGTAQEDSPHREEFHHSG
jgi:hypothetical protein